MDAGKGELQVWRDAKKVFGASLSDLQGHPVVGASWEGFVVEQVAAHLPEGAQLGFYRTAAGAEMDIVVQAGQRSICIEVKFSSAPTVTKGFWHAREDLHPTRTVVVASLSVLGLDFLLTAMMFSV